MTGMSGRRAGFGAHGPRAQRRLDDARDQAGRAAEAARRPRPAAGDRRDAARRAWTRRVRCATSMTRRRGARVPCRRAYGARRGFRRTQGSKDAAAAGALLASQAERLVASDVVWDDLFKEPSVIVLQNEDDQRRRGARLELRPDARPREYRRWSRSGSGSTARPPPAHRRYAAGCTGPTSSPSRCSRAAGALATTENTVEASTDLAFVVRGQLRRQPGGQDPGDADDPAEPDADREEADDRHHQPRSRRRRSSSVTSRRSTSASADHADRRRARPGEEKTDNNTAEYPVIFSLGA